MHKFDYQNDASLFSKYFHALSSSFVTSVEKEDILRLRCSLFTIHLFGPSFPFDSNSTSRPLNATFLTYICVEVIHLSHSFAEHL